MILETCHKITYKMKTITTTNKNNSYDKYKN